MKSEHRLAGNAPSFDLPRVPGVILIPPVGSPVLGSETIDDISYTTQRHEIAIYPQRAGKVTVPEFAIRFDSTPAFGQPVISNKVQTTPITLKAQLPPGAQGLSVIITTRSLKVSQEWNPAANGATAKPGAAFTRTITIEADDVPAMVLPAIHFTAPEGIRVYPQAPVTDDRSNRGQSVGHRVEKATYICEQVGEYSVPALSFAWWDPTAKELHREVIAGANWAVSQAEPIAEQAPVSDEAKPLPRTIVISAFIAAAILLAICALAVVRLTRSTGENDAERTWFFEFELQCQRGNAAKTLHALRNWIHVALPHGSKLVSEELRSQHIDPRLATQIDALIAAVYGRPGQERQWSPPQLLALAYTEREKLLQPSSRSPATSIPLPPLNPVSG